MQHYNQNNYPNILAGYNTSLTYSIKYVGCLIATFSNVLQYIGIHVDPVEMNNRLKAHNCFSPGGAFYISGTLSRVFPELVEENYWPTAQNSYKQIIDEALANPHKVVIFGVDMYPATKDTDWHYVGLYSKTSIIDPNGGTVRPIGTYPIKQIKIFTKKTITELTMSQKQQLENMYKSKSKVLNDPLFTSLPKDEQIAFNTSGSGNEAPDLSFLMYRLNGLRETIKKLQENKTTSVQNEVVSIEPDLPAEPLEVTVERPGAEKFDIDKFLVGFAKVNVDKATYVTSIGIVLTQVNETLSLGVSDGQIASMAGLAALALIVGGAVRQSIKVNE